MKVQELSKKDEIIESNHVASYKEIEALKEAHQREKEVLELKIEELSQDKNNIKHHQNIVIKEAIEEKQKEVIEL